MILNGIPRQRACARDLADAARALREDPSLARDPELVCRLAALLDLASTSATSEATVSGPALAAAQRVQDLLEQRRQAPPAS